MPGSLERRDDGSFALYIDNDIQFDSKDEHIYHEGLVLPSLALASKRIPKALDVLIIGGGDGLVAREIFKSDNIHKVDLVDYDPEILNYAHSDFAQINQFSLSDPRISIHIKDAWVFIDEALTTNRHYNLIIVDLTVPDDVSSARFHSIEWYSKLSELLSDAGMLAVNGVSAFATPEAFWCVFNSMRKGNLHVRPFHVEIPSFAANGSGTDWSFYIASKEKIKAEEFDSNLKLAEPRKFLTDLTHVRELFLFPVELFAYQAQAMPALAYSHTLIHYFNNASTFVAGGDNYNSLTFDFENLAIPELTEEINILPANLISALAQMDFAQITDSHKLLANMTQLLPGLQQQCPPELITEFVENPTNFLAGINLPELIEKLLERAKELPAQLVAELELLRDNLRDWAGDHLSLLALGQKVLTILTLLIIVGNVLYPDSVYGKGEHSEHAGGTAAERGSARGERRSGTARGEGRHGQYVNGTWVDDPYWNGPGYINRRPEIIKEEIRVPANTMPNTNIRRNTTGELPSNIDPAIIQRDLQATRLRLSQNKKDILDQKEVLIEELSKCLATQEDVVDFGIHKIEKGAAIARLQLAIQKAEEQISTIDKQIALSTDTNTDEQV